MAKKSVLKKNGDEILWNLINAGLAGGLVFLGSCTSGGLSLEGIFAGLIAAAIVAVTKFKDYWGKEQGEYSSKIFNFVKI